MNVFIPPEFSKDLLSLGIELSHESQGTLFAYLELLQKWNQSYNLTAITDFSEMVTHHLLDSLSIAPYLQGKRVLDVGTGAGFPGIPLALAYPDYKFVVLDSNGKKIRFITQAIAELGIKNVFPVQERVENFRDSEPFDDIISRAVSDISTLMAQTQHHKHSETQWLLMKGTYPKEELSGFKMPYKVEKLSVPRLEAERHLVIVKEKFND